MAFRLFVRQLSFASTKNRKTKKIIEFFQDQHVKTIPLEVEILQKNISAQLSGNSSIVKVDSLICSRFKSLNVESALSLLQTWEWERPNTLRKTVFYHSFVTMIRKGIWKYNDWNNLVETSHWIGHMNGEEDTKALMISLMHQVNDSPNLKSSHYKDICVVCESAFRSSTGISMPLLNAKIFDVLVSNTDELVEDSVWLVMLVKLIILSKSLSVENGLRLANVWASWPNISRLPFTAQSYVMSLFGNARLRHDGLFSILTKESARFLKEYPERVRVKDLSTVLWSLSSLAFPVRDEFVEGVIFPYLETQINERNLTDGLDILIQCTISLWMLGYCPIFLLERILTNKSLNILKGKKNNYRDLSRFALLSDILEVESKDCTSEQKEVRKTLSSMNLLVPNLQKEVDRRPGLRKLLSNIEKAGFNDVRVEYPVKIFVAGVSGTVEGKHYHFDLADPSYCLLGVETPQPSGVLQAKSQLLQLSKPDVSHKIISERSLHQFSQEDWKKLSQFRKKQVDHR